MFEMSYLDSFVSSVGSGSPAYQAVTLDYVQQHVRALGQTDADLLSVYIDAATSYFFEQTSRSPLTQTRMLLLDCFPFVGASGAAARIELPHPPLQKVLSIRYPDSTGTMQSFVGGSPSANLFTYTAPVGDYATCGSVEPIYGQPWPQARWQTGGVQITYTCGYGDTPGAVPALVRGIICLLVAHFDTFRSAVHEARKGQVLELPYGVEYMLNGFKYSAKSAQLLRWYRRQSVNYDANYGGLNFGGLP